MTDPIAEALDAFVPAFASSEGDWQDILDRADKSRRRRWLAVPRPGTWSRLQIALAVIVVGLMLAAAATATYVAVYVASAPPSKQLVTGRVVKLKELDTCPPKCTEVSTQLRGTKVTFEPFGYGWYGYQADGTGFVVGDRPRGLWRQTQSDFGVGVSRIGLPLKRAALQLESTPGVRVLSVDKGEVFDHQGVPYPRLNGRPAHLYRLLLTRPERHQIFGIPAQSFSGRTQPSWPIHPDMGARERHVDVVLIGAGGKTFLVRFGNDVGSLDPPYFLLMSLRFHTDGS